MQQVDKIIFDTLSKLEFKFVTAIGYSEVLILRVTIHESQ